MIEPTDTVEKAADDIIAALLADPDAIRRYRTVQALQDGGLRDVAATSMRQLRNQLGSTDAAAEALGISRQAMNELLAKAGAPGARADRGLRERPAYQYGRYYDHLCTLAEATENERNRDRIEKLYRPASQTLATFPTLAELASKWLPRARRSPAWRDEMEAKQDDLGARVAEWLTGRADDPWMSIEEQKEFLLGMHHSSHERRQRQ